MPSCAYLYFFHCISCLFFLSFVLSSACFWSRGVLFIPENLLHFSAFFPSTEKSSDLQLWSSVQQDVHVTAGNSCAKRVCDACVYVCVCVQRPQTSSPRSLSPLPFLGRLHRLSLLRNRHTGWELPTASQLQPNNRDITVHPSSPHG